MADVQNVVWSFCFLGFDNWIGNGIAWICRSIWRFFGIFMLVEQNVQWKLRLSKRFRLLKKKPG